MDKKIINLVADGRDITCHAEINKKKMRPIFWAFEMDPDNVKAEFLSRDQRCGFQANCKVKDITITDESGKSDLVFRTSIGGLDKFKVFAGCKPDLSDKKEVAAYEVWRRLYFSVHYTAGMDFTAFGPVTDEFKKYGIEMVREGGGSVSSDFKIIDGQKYLKALDAVVLVKKSKREVRIVFVERICDSIKPTLGPIPVTSTAGSVPLPPDKPAWPWGRNVLSADVSIKGFQTLSVPAADNISGAPIVTAAGTTLRWDFKALPAVRAALREKLPIFLTATVKLIEDPKTMGLANEEARVVISRRNVKDEMRSPAAIQNDLIHELGHAIGMAHKSVQHYNEFNGNPVPKGPEQNTLNYPHGAKRTGHCSFSAKVPDTKIKALESLGYKISGAIKITLEAQPYWDGTCVMFHLSPSPGSVFVPREDKFCSNCAPVIRRLQLDDSLKWPGK